MPQRRIDTSWQCTSREISFFALMGTVEREDNGMKRPGHAPRSSSAQGTFLEPVTINEGIKEAKVLPKLNVEQRLPCSPGIAERLASDCAPSNSQDGIGSCSDVPESGCHKASKEVTGEDLASTKIIGTSRDASNASKDQVNTFRTPEPWIRTPQDLKLFIDSPTYASVLGFIVSLSASVRGVPCPDYDDVGIRLPFLTRTHGEMSNSSLPQFERPPEPSAAIKNLLVLIEHLCESTKKFPPVKQAMRFGNTAFRQWLDYIMLEIEELLEDCLSTRLKASILEIKVYLLQSFGNYTRIDYGTGHELAFCQFLYCLFHIGFLSEQDKPYAVLLVFKCYIKLMRILQTQYNLEPAGSRGVWGLDDFHFLPFLWGASQLQNQNLIQPSDAVERDFILKYSETYLYIDAIKFITETKRGVSFGESSPMLYNISGIHSWSKVASGFVKMYQAEVLQKFPVMQHFRFGSMLPSPSQHSCS